MSNIIDISKPDYVTPIKYGFLAACVIGIFGWAYSSYCSECGFSGTVEEEVPCLTCGGAKVVSCPVYVKKEIRCTLCGGSGKLGDKCSKCNGTGEGPWWRPGKCGECKGAGKVDSKCNLCGGKRTITEDIECGQCMGKGKIKCKSCAGKGYSYLRKKDCPKCKP